MPKINQEEYEVLKELDDKYKWIARNYNGALITYTDKPMKNPNLYWDSFGERMEDRLFQFIQWEDEEPHSIQGLIHDYEYKTGTFDWATAFQSALHGESEEKEVKDLQWMKDQLEKDYADGKRVQSRIKDGEKIEGIDIKSYWRGSQTANYIARCYLEDLDEPEVLSQEWLDENKSSWTKLKIDGYYIPVEKLQNLLVPKQIKPKELYKAITGISPFIEEVCDSSGTETFLDESVSVERIVEAVMEAVGPSEPEKTVIPQFVAEWIESRKNNYPFDVIGVYLRMNELSANEQTREVL